MLRSADIVGLQRRPDALRAACLGRRLGEWSWRATAAVPRTLIAAALAAALWHAVAPALAFSAYLTAIIALRLLMRPLEFVVAAAHRAHATGMRRERK